MKKKLLDLVGNTPLLEIGNFNLNNSLKIFSKLELLNPTGSLKDRMVKKIIEKAEEKGELKEGMTIVEASSGNAGISLCAIGCAKGYKVRIYMPETKTVERRKMIRAFGAELILTSGDSPHSHIEAVEELIKNEPGKYFYLNQNGNMENVLAHYYGTGEEILRELEGTKIDYFVAGLGTGGTLIGVGMRLKEFIKDVKIIAVEPEKPISKIEGLLHRDGSYNPPILKEGIIDETIRVRDEDAIETSKEIWRREGLFVGISSGAVMFASLKLAREMKSGVIVNIFADSGDRYLSVFQ
ncbi:MAG: PLP-dependent cysteine synthase family protein [Candidatus Aminicenantia bacterium]